MLSCLASELHTWVGSVACGLDIYEGAVPGDYVSTFIPPEPHTICQRGVKTRWTGMMSSNILAPGWKFLGKLCNIYIPQKIFIGRNVSMSLLTLDR